MINRPDTSQAIRIWIAEDEDELREVLRDSLSGAGRMVRAFSNGKGVLEEMQRDSFDILLTDLFMPEVDGIELLQKVRLAHPEGIVIIMTGYASVDTAVQAIRGGAYDYIKKPFKLNELELIIKKACERIELIRENGRLLKKLKDAKEELERLKLSWDDHLNRVLGICWMMFREKRNSEFDLVLKQLGDIKLDLDWGVKIPDGNTLETLQRLTELKKDRLITEEEFTSFKKTLLNRLKEG